MKMDEDRARALLSAQRAELETLLQATDAEDEENRESEDEAADGDVDDPAQLLTAEGQNDAIAESLRERLAAVERAEERLEKGTYGVSIRSGQPIPDARLEANPTAELTIEEATADERG
jgi:DnaK suppressor protein